VIDEDHANEEVEQTNNHAMMGQIDLPRKFSISRASAEWNQGKPELIRILRALPIADAPQRTAEERFLMSGESRTKRRYPLL
jgi:hypothetical protein